MKSLHAFDDGMVEKGAFGDIARVSFVQREGFVLPFPRSCFFVVHVFPAPD